MATQQTHPPKRIGIRELRANLSGFMCQVRRGATFIVTLRNEVVAVIQPPRRQPGTLRGQIHMAPDFDMLPADIPASMEGDMA